MLTFALCIYYPINVIDKTYAKIAILGAPLPASAGPIQQRVLVSKCSLCVSTWMVSQFFQRCDFVALLGPVHNSLFYLFSNRVSLCSPALPGTSLPLPRDGWKVYTTTPVQHMIPSDRSVRQLWKDFIILSSRPGETAQWLRTLVQFSAPTWWLPTTCDSGSRDPSASRGTAYTCAHM